MLRSTWWILVTACVLMLLPVEQVRAEDARLPADVRAVWDMSKTWREITPTRERICINGLWRWQPVPSKAEGPVTEASETVPEDNWGYFKVPGPWPGTSGRDRQSQAHYAHPSWKDVDISKVEQTWYQREVVIPKEWTGRRILLDAQYVNNSAVVFLDGKNAG